MTGLIPLAVLVSTARSLKGATLIGANVLESPLDPIESVLDEFSGRPLIAVYVGTEEHTTEGREFLRGDTRLDLTFQIFLPEECTVQVDGHDVVLDTRGRGVEVAFATIWRQCVRALLVDSGTWSPLWKDFVLQISKVTTEPFLLQIGKTRVAAREITMAVETLREPAFGSPPDGPWAAFVAALRAEPDYGDAIADLVAFEIEAPAGLPSWQAIQASLGMTREAMLASGLAPVAIDGAPVTIPETGEPAPMTEGALADEESGETLTQVAGERPSYLPPEEP